MDLNIIKNEGKWQEMTGDLNQNFTKIKVDFEKQKNQTSNDKGIYLTDVSLKAMYPAANNKKGFYAFVGSANPFRKWEVQADGGQWIDTTQNIDIANIDLAEYSKNGGSSTTMKQMDDKKVEKSVYDAEVPLKADKSALEETNTKLVLKADKTTLDAHVADKVAHVTKVEKDDWNAKPNMNDIGDIWHDISLLEDDKLDKSAIASKLGNDTTKVPSLSLLNHISRGDVFSGSFDWYDVFNVDVTVGFICPKTVYDSPKATHRPSFLAANNTFNILPFAQGDGETSFLIHDINNNTLYIYNAVESIHVKLADADSVIRDRVRDTFAAGHFSMPLSKAGDGSGVLRLEVSLLVTTKVTLVGDAYFYDDITATTGARKIVELTPGTKNLYIKVYGDALFFITNGTTTLGNLGIFATGGVNEPSSYLLSECLPASLAWFDSGSLSNFNGVIKLSDIPLSINRFVFLFKGNIKCVGNLSSFKNLVKANPLVIGYTTANCFVDGDIANILHLKTFTIITSGALTYSGFSFAQAFENIKITVANPSWTQAMTDNLLIDIAAGPVISGKILNLAGVAKRSSASDAAVATLQSKGVILTL